MRKYIFGTGLLSAITSGLTLFRSLRSNEPFTWRTALGWLSWGITLALAIGAVVDTRRSARGKLIAGGSPLSKGEQKRLLRERVKR